MIAPYVTGRPLASAISARVTFAVGRKNIVSRSGRSWIVPCPASRSTPHNASSSSRSASRLGTGLPSIPLSTDPRGGEPDHAGRQRLAQQLRHPGDLTRRRSTITRLITHDVIPQGGVSHHPRHVESGPGTLIESRYSGNDSNDQSIAARNASADMPSTFSNVNTTVSRGSGRVGATAYPQFPIITDVMPCQHDGTRSRSHVTCACRNAYDNQ